MNLKKYKKLTLNKILAIIIKKDGEGYLAKIKDHQNLFAFAYSKKEAIRELNNVVEMIMDYQLEQVNNVRVIKNELTLLR